jgi:hypothetical protein
VAAGLAADAGRLAAWARPCTLPGAFGRAACALALVGLLLLAGLAAKLVSEQPLGPVLRAAPELGIAIAPWSHLSGSVAGLLCAAAVVLAPALARRAAPRSILEESSCP